MLNLCRRYHQQRGQKWKMCGSVQKFELTTGKEFNRRSHISHNMEHLRAPQSIQEHFWALIKPFERMQQANYKRAPYYTFGWERSPYVVVPIPSLG